MKNMSLHAYVDCDPKIKSILFFSKACFSLSVGTALLSLTNLLAILYGFVPSKSNCEDCVYSLDYQVSFYFLVGIIFSFVIAGVGALSNILLKLVSLREINNRMKLELDED